MVVDTLELNIIVNSPNTAKITNLTNSLQRLYTYLGQIQTQDFSRLASQFNQIATSVTPLAAAINSLASANTTISGLTTRINSLNKAMAGLDTAMMANKFKAMASAVAPFVSQLKSAEASLVALNSLSKNSMFMGAGAQGSAANAAASTTFLGFGGFSGKAKRSGSGGFGSLFGKIYSAYFILSITKRLGQSLGKIVQKGIDYEETLNLWQVAMKGNVDQAKKFVSEIGKAYGISNEVTMRYQATFKNMLSALGHLNADVAYGLSEALTQMALDYSSLYNTSIESAMIKFQSALAGQVRPIRSESGYDITEITLYQLYQDIGGTKTVRQLTQTEKRLLRILAIYNQMKDTAKGDLARTITSTANQMRVMSEQGKELATWIGIAGNLWIHNSQILVKINSYLYAAVAVAKAYAYALGYVEKSASEDPFGDMGESADNANESIEKLQGKLLGFDKFQVLSSSDNTDADVISSEITKAMTDIQSILSGAVNPAFEASLEILKSWGLQLDENGDIVGGLDEVIQKVKDFGKGLAGVITLITFMVKPWITLVSAIEYAYFTNEEFRNSVTLLFSVIGPAGLTVMKSLTNLFVELVPMLTYMIEFTTYVIVLLDKLGLLEPAIMLVVAALIAWKTVNIILTISKTIFALKALVRKLGITTTSLNLTKIAAIGLAVGGFLLASNAAKNLFANWDNMSGLEKAIEIFKLLAGAAMVAAVAIGVFHTSWSAGIMAGAIVAGIALLMGYMETIKTQTNEIGRFANGGLATKGSLFYAGEAGPELVTRTSGGNSTIMNMKQLEDAVARGMIRGAAATQGGNGQQISVNVSGRSLFSIFVDEAKSNGYELVKVR